MEIEIRAVGKSNKWVVSQSHIRIGRDTNCEISLPARQFPGILPEHLALDVVLGTVRVSSVGDPSGEIFVNDRVVKTGSVIRSGDVLRLGAGGPQLSLRLLESQAASPPSDYAPTQVLYQATRDMKSAPDKTVASAPPPPVSGSARRHGYAAESSPAAPPRTEYAPAAGVRRSAPPQEAANGPSGQAGSDRRDPGSGSSAQEQPQPVLAKGADNDSLRMLEGKLNGMRILMAANLVLLAALLIWVVQLNRQLSENRQELQQMHTQAQSALTQLAPSLDARLGNFEKRMDAMDGKMKAAEDHMVSRMNTEIPAMLNKYVNQYVGTKQPGATH